MAAASPDPSSVPAHYEDPVGVTMKAFLAYHGKQAGDPEKAVERMFEIATGEGLAGSLKGKVLRLVLGSDAMARIRKNTSKYIHELDLQEETSKSTDVSE